MTGDEKERDVPLQRRRVKTEAQNAQVRVSSEPSARTAQGEVPALWRGLVQADSRRIQGHAVPVSPDGGPTWEFPAQQPAVDDARRLGMVTHELRGCMTPVSLQVDLLRSGRLGQLTPRQDNALEAVSRSVERLLSLLQDLLDTSRISANRLRLDVAPVDLRDLVQEVVAAFEAQAQRAEVSLVRTHDGPGQIIGDPLRLMQVLTNLISNAVKATPSGGSVVVSTRYQDDGVELAVRDTGRGLEPDEVAVLFQPFAQAGDAVCRSRGTGLGLYIVRGIVEQHGGAIEISSDGRGRGSTFRVWLPTHPEAVRRQ